MTAENAKKRSKLTKKKKHRQPPAILEKAEKHFSRKPQEDEKETAIAPITVTIIYSIYHPDMQRNGENWPLMNKKKREK